MKCPFCGSFMKSGQAEIHGTLLGFFAVGFSYENLYFNADNEKEIRILQSGCSTPSLRCPNCEIVILNKDESDIINESDFSETTRESVFNSLNLWSSKDKQLAYMERFPEQNFLEELFYQWKNSYKADLEDFRDAFQSEELFSLFKFDQELTRVLNRIDLKSKDFDSFVDTLDWKKLNLIAKDILKKINKNG